ncbi:hypothetical protein LASHA2_06590 [Lactiplantibacillus plantarum]
MTIKCSICGKELKTWDKAFFKISIPPRSFTEIRKFLKENSVIYCKDCIKKLS